jgi:hypothetical protein
VSPLDPTEGIVSPTETAGPTLYEWVEIGRRVREMCDTDAWVDLRRGIAAAQTGKAALLMGQPGDRDQGVLAKMIGEMAGLAQIPTVAAELIQEGDRAAQEIRAREEGS